MSIFLLSFLVSLKSKVTMNTRGKPYMTILEQTSNALAPVQLGCQSHRVSDGERV